MLWSGNPFITNLGYISEADGDEEGKPSFTPPASDNDTNPDDSDYTLDDGTDDEGNDPNEPEPQSDEPTEDNGEDNTGDDEDYSLGDEGEDGDSTEDQSGNEDDTSSNEDSTDDGTDPRQKLRDLENSIFDQLSEDQKASKIKELKGLFNSTYFNCQKIINNIDHVQKTPDNVKIYDYVSTTLNDLMKYIKDYLQDTFDNRTYMENVVEFEKYLSILDSIKKIFIELKTASNDNE